MSPKCRIRSEVFNRLQCQSPVLGDFPQNRLEHDSVISLYTEFKKVLYIEFVFRVDSRDSICNLLNTSLLIRHFGLNPLHLLQILLCICFAEAASHFRFDSVTLDQFVSLSVEWIAVAVFSKLHMNRIRLLADLRN